MDCVSILKKETLYNNNITSLQEYIQLDIPLVLSTWAEDKNLDMSQLVEAGNSLIEYTENYYGTYTRLYPVDSAEPSLKCNTKGLDSSTGTEAKAIRYKNVLGILSADEVAFAGSTAYKSGTT